MRYIETELGTEKQCFHCKDYFPATKEFFFAAGRTKKDGTVCLDANCKACYKEKFKPWIKRCNNVAHRYEVA